MRQRLAHKVIINIPRLPRERAQHVLELRPAHHSALALVTVTKRAAHIAYIRDLNVNLAVHFRPPCVKSFKKRLERKLPSHSKTLFVFNVARMAIIADFAEQNHSHSLKLALYRVNLGLSARLFGEFDRLFPRNL